MTVRTLGDILLVAGAAWMLLAAYGILRFEDTYARMHALTKASTLGLLLVLAGASVHLSGPDVAKLALVGVFVFITAPVGAHLVSRALTRWPGAARVKIDTINELSDASGESGSKDGG